MNEKWFRVGVIAIAGLFTILFCALVVPPLIDNPDVFGAFAAGFVNPYASGYSADVISCWAILALWVWFEATSLSIKHGWVCLVLGIIPGVAVGFALYLLLRQSQLKARGSSNA